MNDANQLVAELKGRGAARLTDLRPLRVSGRDAPAFLHRVLTSDVRSLASGEGQPTALLTPKSHVRALATLLRLDDHALLLTPGPCADELRAALEGMVIADDVEVEALDAKVVQLAGDPLRDDPLLAPYLERGFGAHAAADDLPLEARVVADDGLGLSALLLIAEEAAPLLAWARGRGFEEARDDVWETCRIMAGSPAYGSEIDQRTLLLEAGQLARVSFDKGCYIGQEPVCRVHNRGQVNRRLVGLALPEDADAEAGARLTHAAKPEAGWVSSVARASVGGRRPALGYLHRKALEDPQGIRLESGGAPVALVDLPQHPALAHPRVAPRYGDAPNG